MPELLERLYGQLWFPVADGYIYVSAIFVTTLDGVATLGIPGKPVGEEIVGFSPHDRMNMGLLRAVADAVIVGSSALEDGTKLRHPLAYANIRDGKILSGGRLPCCDESCYQAIRNLYAQALESRQKQRTQKL